MAAMAVVRGKRAFPAILDGMGYDYVAFDDHHFNEDLQYVDAVPMFRRLSFGGVLHAIEESIHLFPPDSLQIIAHGHVEYKALRVSQAVVVHGTVCSPGL